MSDRTGQRSIKTHTHTRTASPAPSVCCIHGRRAESNPYSWSPYICETHNTLSNLPFIVLAVVLAGALHWNYPAPTHNHPYWNDCMTLCLVMGGVGIGSGIHHATPHSLDPITIIIDYIPIVSQLYLFATLPLQPLHYFTAWWGVAILTSLFVLSCDHIALLSEAVTRFNADMNLSINTHSVWHVMAAVTNFMILADVFIRSAAAGGDDAPHSSSLH